MSFFLLCSGSHVSRPFFARICAFVFAHVDDELFSKHIEPEPAPEPRGLGHGRGVRRRGRRAHARRAALSLRSSTCPPAPASAHQTVELGALHRIALGVRRWTSLISPKKLPLASCHIVSLLSHVSVVPCVFVLSVLPRLPDSDQKVCCLFFFRLKKC